jgi:hypothetical protein
MCRGRGRLVEITEGIIDGHHTCGLDSAHTSHKEGLHGGRERGRHGEALLAHTQDEMEAYAEFLHREPGILVTIRQLPDLAQHGHGQLGLIEHAHGLGTREEAVPICVVLLKESLVLSLLRRGDGISIGRSSAAVSMWQDRDRAVHDRRYDDAIELWERHGMTHCGLKQLLIQSRTLPLLRKNDIP